MGDRIRHPRPVVTEALSNVYRSVAEAAGTSANEA